MSVSVKIGSTWRNVDQLYIKIGGAWRKVSNVFTKVSGQWKPSYSYSWSIGAWSACSVSCGGGTQSRVVTCVRNDGKTVEDSLCGSKPVTSQVCNTQACQPVEDCRFVMSNDNLSTSYYWQTTFNGWNNVAWGSEINWFDQRCSKSDPTPCVVRGYKYYRGNLRHTLEAFYYEVCRVPV